MTYQQLKYGPSVCKTYSEFQKMLKHIRKKYKILGPKGEIGKQTGMYEKNYVPCDEIQEFIKGGIISTMAAWEAFISDLMEEAFTVLTCECSCHPAQPTDTCECYTCKDDEKVVTSPSELSKRWKGFKPAVTASIKKRSKKNKSAEAEAYEMLMDANTLNNLIFDHQKTAINERFTPVFIGEHKINSTFRALFKGDEKMRLSELMIGMGPVSFHYRLNESKSCQMQIADEETLSDILRLYYGMRCILAHGKPGKTLNHGGVLESFPSENSKLAAAKELFEAIEAVKKALGDEKKDLSPYLKMIPSIRGILGHIDSKPFISDELQEAKEKLKDLQPIWPDVPQTGELINDVTDMYVYFDLFKTFDRFNKFGRKTRVNYLTLVRLNRFIYRLSYRTMLAIAKHLYDECQVLMWEYDPKRTREERLKKESEEESKMDHEDVLTDE